MYSPKISEKYIPILYQLGKALNQPMTKLVNRAVKSFLGKHKKELEPNIETEDKS